MEFSSIGILVSSLKLNSSEGMWVVVAEDTAIFIDSGDQITILAHLSHLKGLYCFLLMHKNYFETVLGSTSQNK
jgi:hypothetical protein